jgi:hypothetical protein
MVETLLGLLALVFPRHLQCEREVASRYGIADVVVAEANSAELEARLTTCPPMVLRPADARVLAAFNNLPLASDQVISSLPMSRGAALRSLSSLERSGHVSRDALGVRRTVAEPYREIVAIEAKLDDWGRALCQARRYAEYADYAYIALPVDRVSRVDHLQLRTAGIGLLSVSATAIEIVVPAPLSTAIQPWRRTFVAEALAMAWVSKRLAPIHQKMAFDSRVPIGSQLATSHLG